MKSTLLLATALLSGCSVITGLSSSCINNAADGSRMCTVIDTNQNVTTRTIERDNKLFVSTCSYSNCTDFKEVDSKSTTKPASPAPMM